MARPKGTKNRASAEAEAKGHHDRRTGKAVATRSESAATKKRGNQTTAPMAKGRPTRDHSDNKKARSGR